MSDTPWALFRFCPHCGTPRGAIATTPDPFQCDACGFLFFFNPAVAVAALIVRRDGLALFIRRARDPARGRLALVGGFVDPGENAEHALRREIREEVGLELDELTFLSSSPNDYHYRGTTYPVVDLIFLGTTADDVRTAALDGVASFEWLDPMAVDPEGLAFPSMRDGLRRYREVTSR
jgi:ADP-ribose pyrophosphatase YjhB (NUDIX family)